MEGVPAPEGLAGPGDLTSMLLFVFKLFEILNEKGQRATKTGTRYGIFSKRGEILNQL